MSALSLIQEENTNLVPKTKSMESLYSSSSSKYSANIFLRRRPGQIRQPAIVPAVSEVRQRVISARVQRVKHLQNQLSEAHQQISELSNENRTLKTSNKRQDSALTKYESKNAELPQLLYKHDQEIKTWQIKYKNLYQQNKELNIKLKQRDALFLKINDDNKHLIHLNEDKHLEDREKLTERVKELELRLQEKDNHTSLLNRRLQLETKNYKSHLQGEHHKSKDLSLKLEKANEEILKLTSIIESLEKKLGPSIVRTTYSMKTLQKPFSKLNTTTLGTHSQNINKNTPNLDNSTISNTTFNCFSSSVSSMEKPKSNDISDTDEFAIPYTENFLLANFTKSTEIKNNFRENGKKLIKNGITALRNSSSSAEENDEIYEYSEDSPDDNQALINSKNEENSSDTEELTADFKEIELTNNSVVVQEFEKFKKEIRDEIFKKEALLDTFCDSATRDSEKTALTKETVEKKTKIDPKKKVKLLAALKAIDVNVSYDS